MCSPRPLTPRGRPAYAHAQMIAPPRCPRGYKSTSAILFSLFLYHSVKVACEDAGEFSVPLRGCTPLGQYIHLGTRPKWHLFDIQMVCFPVQLARDLLHPSPEEEKRKHKLKRLVQSPNSFFMDVKCPGERIKDKRPCVFVVKPEMVIFNWRWLHACCHYRLLQDHHRVQSCTDRCAVCQLQHCVGAAHWREGKTH